MRGNDENRLFHGLTALFATALALLCLSSVALGQSDEEKTRQQLRQLEKDIKRINWEISSASARRDRLQDQLRVAEVELGNLQRDIARAGRDIRENESELVQLRERRGELEQARDAQRSRIALEMKSAWQIGNQGQLKLLFNQEDPHTVARTMAYYRYLFEARNELLEQYRQTLEELQQVGARIDANLAQLDEYRQALEKKRRQLTVAQGNRELAVMELSDSIDSKGAELKQLQANRAELESLLEAIEEAVVDLQVPDDYQPFASVRGQMPWPVKGKPGNRFGRKRNADMRWQGVKIAADEGSTVRAIHHGRVVYADWLRGSGLLLILDHGDGYMSLYAHNQSLLRDVGEWVTAGTPISTVGSSGGQERPALYFEVRHQGKPVDPGQWCSG